MRLVVTFLALFTGALAVPAPVPGAHAIADTDNHKVSLPETGDANPLSIRQEMQCDWDGFCADAFQKCVQTCDSLDDSDWQAELVRMHRLQMLTILQFSRRLQSVLRGVHCCYRWLFLKETLLRPVLLGGRWHKVCEKTLMLDIVLSWRSRLCSWLEIVGRPCDDAF